MKKKIVLTIMAMMVVVAGVISLSAFEAHIINVTAHNENALTVIPRPIEFGTVFPQEIFTGREFTVSLSKSFMATDRVDDVEYFVQTKPKPRPSDQNQDGDPYQEIEVGQFTGPNWKFCLDSEPIDAGNPQDSYYIHCYPDLCGLIVVFSDEPYGYLAKSTGNISDTWKIDLAVPCFQGMCDQGYDPEIYGEPLDPRLESQIFGCDVWVEVEGISYPPDIVRFPEKGTAYIGYEDRPTGSDFDYNDFGMNMELEEIYVNGALESIWMKFTSVVNRAGDLHDINIFRSLKGDYAYTITRYNENDVSQAAWGNETAAVTDAVGSGNFDITLFDTQRWPNSAGQVMGQWVEVKITMAEGNDQNLLTDYGPHATRWDLEEIFSLYDPWMFNRSHAIGNINIGMWQAAASPLPEPYEFDVPYIIVVPKTGWVAPGEGVSITTPYPEFDDYYRTESSTYENWYE